MGETLESIAAGEAERALGDSGTNGRFLRLLDDTLSVLERLEVPFLLMGGLASSVLGRPRATEDIDVFVRSEDARMVLEGFEVAGFETKEEFPHWLFKAYRDGGLVDLVFRSTGGIYLDEEMERHAVHGDFRGRTIRVVGPEDMVVIKALAHEEPTPRHWFDALGIIGRQAIDWDYLASRARRGPRRVLSLLLYAQSIDLPVPASVVKELFRMVEEGAG